MAQQLSFKNIKVNGTVEHFLAKIWVMATGQPLTKEAVDALIAFKSQDESWQPAAATINVYLSDTLSERGGNQDAYVRELLANAGATFSDAEFSTALQYFTGKGITGLLDIFITVLLDTEAPGHATLNAKASTQGAELLTSLGLTNLAPTGSLSIQGAARVGEVLSLANTLADADGIPTSGANAMKLQWLANGQAISGATASSLTLDRAHVGKTISVKATWTDNFGTAESVTSTATAAVANVNTVPSGILAIQGTAREDATLTAVSTLADADGIPTSGANAMKLQWLANGQAIAGATASSLTLDQAHVGKTIAVKATWTDNGGAAESVTSTATASVANVNDAPTGSVTVSGTARVGEVLSVANTLADADGIPTSGANAIKYQWLANGQAISGATASSLTLDQAHVGKTIAVKAQYTDNFGTAESVTSTATAAVTPPPDFGRMEPVTFTGPFGEFRYREDGTFADYVSTLARGSTFFEPVGRVLSFDGPMMFYANGEVDSRLDFISASVDLPIYDPTGMQENVRISMRPLVLDFSNGAKHAVIDIAPRVYENEYWVILKNFEADDSLSFGIKANDRDAGGIVGSYLNKPLTISSTGHFSSLDAYYQSGRSLLESQSLGRVNAAFLPDASFQYKDLMMGGVLNGIFTSANFLEPENLELRSVGALVLDVNAYTPHSNGLPGYETYSGMGADGLSDLVISFVGSMPDLSQINLAGTTLFG